MVSPSPVTPSSVSTCTSEVLRTTSFQYGSPFHSAVNRIVLTSVIFTAPSSGSTRHHHPSVCGYVHAQQRSVHGGHQSHTGDHQCAHQDQNEARSKAVAEDSCQRSADGQDSPEDEPEDCERAAS